MEDDVLGPDPTIEQEPKGVPQPEETQVEPIAEAATPAADTDTRQVPLRALEAVRGEKNDWKEKFADADKRAALEQQRAEMLEARLREREQAPQQDLSPEKLLELRTETIVLNTSERMARKVYGDAEVDKAFAKFKEAVSKDPTLHQRAMSQADPWDYVVREAKRMTFLEEVGDDPAAYRKKIEDEIRASLQPDTRPTLPQSLANARSSGVRSTNWTGPPGLDVVFPDR